MKKKQDVVIFMYMLYRRINMSKTEIGLTTDKKNPKN